MTTKTTTFRIGTQEMTPKPSTFYLGTQEYRLYRFPSGEGKNLAQAIEFAKGKGIMLTLEEARVLTGYGYDHNKESKELKAVLNRGEWFYVRDANAEKRSRAAWLGRFRGGGRLDAYAGDWPHFAAPVVLLKARGKLAGFEERITELEQTARENKEKLDRIRAILT